jgi:predicted glycosyltransferase
VISLDVWIDLTNAPHVHYFCQLIKKFEKEGIEYILTYRDSKNLAKLIGIYNFAGKCIGKHGKTLKDKLIFYAERVIALSELISNAKPKVAIAKHSVELPRVAFGLNIPIIFVVDNEHAEAQNRLTLSLANEIIKPIATDENKLRECGGRNFINFDGTCEVANVNSRLKGYYPIDNDILEKLEISNEKPTIVMRPCPNSSYCNGHKDILPDIIKELRNRIDCNIVVFPRDEYQKEDYIKLNAIVPKNTIDALSLLYNSDFMIGAGGTMNRESAILGIPTVSCYPQELLGVDIYLIEKNRMIHTNDIKEIISYVEDNLGKKLGVIELEDPTDLMFERICSYLK